MKHLPFPYVGNLWVHSTIKYGKMLKSMRSYRTYFSEDGRQYTEDMHMATENNETLASLLDRDRGQVCSSLQADRSSDHARQVLEKETDRLMYLAAQSRQDPARSMAVQGMLQVVRNTLPFLESVNETEVWEKNSAGKGEKKIRITIPAAAALIAGLVLAACGLFSQALAGRILSLPALLWSAGGCVLLVLGGWLTGRGTLSTEKKAPEVSHTFLVDPAQVWHVLQGVVLAADHSLEEAGEYARLSESQSDAESGNILGKEEMAFFCELLENAYAAKRKDPQDEALAEQVESIRYYLHFRGIDTEDYSENTAGWFEVLPSDGTRATIRPALLHNGTLLRKGLATY